jgi:O-antigen/teichoic acid export membrane protein
MKERSVKTNYFLNLFRVASSALVGIFIMPYINKILGPESIGKVEYVYVIINYFIIF